MSGPRTARGILTALLVVSAAGAVGQPRPAPANAEQDYVLHCRGCHGAAGRGIPGRVPPVRGSLAGLMRAPAGREFVMRVPGAANSALSAAALAAVLNWMASTFAADELAPETPSFTAAEIAAVRGQPLLGVRSVRRSIVRQLAAVKISVADDY